MVKYKAHGRLDKGGKGEVRVKDDIWVSSLPNGMCHSSRYGRGTVWGK